MEKITLVTILMKSICFYAQWAYYFKKINQSYILAAVYKLIYGDNTILIFVHFLLQRHTNKLLQNILLVSLIQDL